MTTYISIFSPVSAKHHKFTRPCVIETDDKRSASTQHDNIKYLYIPPPGAHSHTHTLTRTHSLNTSSHTQHRNDTQFVPQAAESTTNSLSNGFSTIRTILTQTSWSYISLNELYTGQPATLDANRIRLINVELSRSSLRMTYNSSA